MNASTPICLTPRRGMSRGDAAKYICVSPTTFDKLVSKGQMPGPISIGARKVWDIRKLDQAFDELSEEVPAIGPDPDNIEEI